MKRRRLRSGQAERVAGGSGPRHPEHSADAVPPARSRRRTWLLVGLAVILLLVFLQLGGPGWVTGQFAESALRMHDHPRAHVWLDRGARFGWLTGKDATSAWVKARIARREGDLREMEKQLQAASERGLSTQRVKRERILAAVQSGQLERHEATVNRWLMDADGDSAEICDAYANGLALVSRLDDAAKVLEAWHADDPTHPVPLYRLGKLHEYFDDQEAAERAYLEASEKEASYPPALFRLANLYLDAKQPAKALDLYERCAAIDNPLAAQVGMARAMIDLGQPEQAKRQLEQVLSEPAERLEDSYRSLKENPETFIAAREFGKLLLNEGKSNESLRWLEVALEKNPRDLAARYSRAVALRRTGRQDEATEEFREVAETKAALEQVNVLRNQIGRNPNDAESRVMLGSLLLEHESERNGLFWLNSALTVDPQYVDAHARLASYYEDRKGDSPKYRELAEHHRRLARAGPGDGK